MSSEYTYLVCCYDGTCNGCAGEKELKCAENHEGLTVPVPWGHLQKKKKSLTCNYLFIGLMWCFMAAGLCS